MSHTTLVELLQERAAREPGRLAFRFLVDGDDLEALLTYGELDRRARAIAACLIARGAVGERALLLHPPGLAWLESFFGCLYAGVVAVPGYPPRSSQQLARLAALAADAQARFALAAPDQPLHVQRRQGAWPALEALTWISPESVARHAPEELHAPPAAADSLALLQYTSGSTSAPKGVMLSQAHLLANASLFVERARISSDDRGVAWLPPYHDMGLIGFIVAPVIAGGQTTLFPPVAFIQRPLRWLRAITRYRATITGGPDSAYDLCVRRAGPSQLASLDLGSVRLAFTGAERVRPETLERFSRTFAEAGFRSAAFCACYGLAEATLAVSMHAAGQPTRVRSLDERALREGRAQLAGAGAGARSLAGAGTPLSGCEVRIVDPETRTGLPPDRVGEIWVRGPSIAAGYWQKPELTGSTFGATLAGARPAAAPIESITTSIEPIAAPHYLRTGDLGFLVEGELFVTGRLKDLLIFLGVNYSPEDLEETSQAAHPRLRRGGGVAFSIESDGSEQLVLVHEVDRAGELPAEEIASAIRSAIAEQHQLAVHEVVLVAPGGVPRTSSGKLQRSLCRERYLEDKLAVLAHSRRGVPEGEAAPPALVERVAALFALVLGQERVEPDDDFFALGGHSLLATQLISRVREALGLELPLRAVFEAATPLALAAVLVRCPPMTKAAPIAKLDRSGPLPLSFSQERMWFLHQLEPGGAAYNVAGALSVEGPLQAAALEQALAALVRRHEVLRCNFPSAGGVPRVVIAPSLALSLAPIDLAAEADPQAAAAAQAADFSAAPFDLARDPLIRARLYRTGPDRHVIAVCLHHLVADGWSMGILLAELLRDYTAQLQGRAPDDTPGILQYIDYAGWQRLQLGADRLERELAWWKQELAGAPMLELPLDRPRPLRRSSAGAHLPLSFPGELLEALRGLAREQGATLSMVMLAAFEVLLHRYSGQTDLVIGTPIANRNQLASEALVGTLVNTLPLRLRIDPDATFVQLLRRLRESALDAWTHQDVPFERIVSGLGLQRRPGESPLFQVLFDFQNAPMPAGNAGALRLRPLTFTRGASQFDLSLLVLDTDLGQVASFAYSTELFESSTIERLSAHYLRVLEEVAARPRTTVSRIPLLSAAERAARAARPKRESLTPPPEEFVHRLFQAQAQRTPDAPAVIDTEGALSYRQLELAASSLARRLRRLGAGPGARVAICLERSRAAVVALLGVLEAGAAYVPLDPRYPPDRLAFVLEDSAPAAIVTDEALRERLAVPAGVAVICLGGDGWGRDEPNGDFESVQGKSGGPGRDELAYLIYTSGSTGRPKGVEVTHFAVANFLRSMGREPGIAPSDRMLSVTTLSFDIAGLEIFLPLVNGACVQLAPAGVVADGPRLAELIDRSGATLMQATPATWRLLIEAGWRGSGRLRILCGGEALSRGLADQLLARGSEVWNLYGPTETTIWSTLQRVEEGSVAVPIGRPIDHTCIHVLDRHGEPTPPGVAGEIHIGGAGVARGYFRRPELTAERFIADPFEAPGARMYRTGDAGRLRADGTLEYLGRLDQQIKLRGLRIEPGEIEAVLREHPAVAAAVVIAREDRPGDVRLVAYCVLNPNIVTNADTTTSPSPTKSTSPSTIDHANAGEDGLREVAELRELCRRKLPEQLVPSALVLLEALPLTPNGKLDRQALPPPGEAQQAPEVPPLAPRDALEEELMRLWHEVLGARPPGIRDSFFQLGGHSLLAVRLFAGLERRTGIALPLATLVEGPTIEHQAACIRAERLAQEQRRAGRPAQEQGGAGRLAQEQARASAQPLAPSEQRALVGIRKSGTQPPLFCVHGAGGNVLNLHEVARQLGPDRPFYALQARAADGVAPAAASIEEMAADYLIELRALQPRGPYYLSGYCGGGVIAYEMAQRLRAAGEPVAALILIDLALPGAPPVRSRLREWWNLLAAESAAALWKRARGKLARDLGEAAFAIRLRYHQARNAPVPYELRSFWLTRAFLRAVARYHLLPYPGKLIVFRAREGGQPGASGPDLGWARLAAGGVAAYEVPGTHHSLTNNPNVEVLAAQLDACLRAAADDLQLSRALPGGEEGRKS